MPVRPDYQLISTENRSELLSTVTGTFWYRLVGLLWTNYTRRYTGKQDYKKTKPALKATRLKAEAKTYSSGFRDAFLVIAAILFFVLCIYAFFYLNLSTELNLDLD